MLSLCLLFLAKLEQVVPKSGMRVRVRDLLHTHVMHEFEVLLGLLPLEFLDGDLPMVNGQEMHQLFVILDVLIGDFDA